jgi:hypothetical protein
MKYAEGKPGFTLSSKGMNSEQHCFKRAKSDNDAEP